MTTVRNILALVRHLAPPELAESWDNNGLLCGRMDAPVTRVLVALDPSFSAAQEAADWGAELLLTHHPLIFRPIASVSDETATGKTLLYLIEHGVAAVNAHTCLDRAPGGVNDTLAQMLGLTELCGDDLWRGGCTETQSLPDFAAHVRESLGAAGVRIADAGRPVHRVAVCGGAGMDYLQAVAAAGYDTFVTGDVKYNGFRDAVDLGVNLIDAGHFATENPVCAVLAKAVAEAFPAVEVRVSERHGDIVQFG